MTTSKTLREALGEKRDEPDTQYRWNHEYRGTWE